jgi:hypothetical protein
MSTKIQTLSTKVDSLPNRENAAVILDFCKYIQDNDNMNMVKECIGKHITRIPGIQSTLTLMSE